ncbi:MAG: sigma-54 dependent transcriptional regulator [Planctomycetota bacterium]
MTAPAVDNPTCPTILVIDDDPLVSVVVRRALDGVQHRLHSALDGQTGVQEVVTKQPDLIVLDNVLPDGLGVDVVGRIHELSPDVPILFVTARGSGSTAIEAMKLSAFDYLPKPLEPTKLRRQIHRALSLRQLLREDKAAEAPGPIATAIARQEPINDALVGECPAMQAVFKAIGKVAMLDVTVLLRGEHGTGKEAIAREIHKHSLGAEGPFVRLHCPGLDEGRLEEELFGREPGVGGDPIAGKLAEAAGGTLLLQEIGRLPLSIQSRILQAIRDGVYENIGGSQPLPLKCRVVAITSEDLEELVRVGEFRSDLYYALSSFVITLPPLRQRHGDLPLLVNHSLRKLRHITDGFNIERPIVSDEAMRVLCSHIWPGNIDELESVLKRVLVEQKGHILLAGDLQQAFTGDPVVAATETPTVAKFTTDWASFTEMRIDGGGDTLHAEAIAETERKLFSRVLRHTGGNQAQAARLLGITRASLRKKLRIYGMTAQQPED